MNYFGCSIGRVPLFLASCRLYNCLHSTLTPHTKQNPCKDKVDAMFPHLIVQFLSVYLFYILQSCSMVECAFGSNPLIGLFLHILCVDLVRCFDHDTCHEDDDVPGWGIKNNHQVFNLFIATIKTIDLIILASNFCSSMLQIFWASEISTIQLGIDVIRLELSVNLIFLEIGLMHRLFHFQKTCHHKFRFLSWFGHNRFSNWSQRFFVWY